MLIYSIDLNEVSAEELDKWFDSADPLKQESILNIQSEPKRQERIAADYLRKKAIADYCGIAQEKIEFDISIKGKPLVKNLDVHFNISHSSGYVVCAVSDKEIGIDIEKIREINPRAAEKFASPQEIEYIRNSKNGFFEIWTLKEAYFKCIGTGLGADIKKVSFTVNKDGTKCSENGFEFFFKEIADGYICSVCQRI